MKNIALIGYYGFNNAGDDAILYSIIRSLKQRDQKINITVLSNNPEKTTRRYEVVSKNRWKWLDVLKTITSSDVLVFGGGSLLQDVTSTRSLDYYLIIARLGLWFRKKVYFMAQGIGPLKLDASKKKVAKTLNKVSLITVRDSDSKQKLLDMGIVEPRIEITADMVFSLYRNEIERSFGHKLLERNQIDVSENAKLVGISVRHWKNLTQYKKKIAELVDALMDKGFQALFIPFHFPDDVGCARDVAKQMNHEPYILKDECTTLEMLGVLSSLDVFVGMRLHGLVMASVMGIPSVGISYDPKIEAAIEMIGQVSGGRVENIDSDKIIYDVQQLSLDREEYQENVFLAVDNLRSRARKNIDYLMEMLGPDDHE